MFACGPGVALLISSNIAYNMYNSVSACNDDCAAQYTCPGHCEPVFMIGPSSIFKVQKLQRYFLSIDLQTTFHFYKM